MTDPGVDEIPQPRLKAAPRRSAGFAVLAPIAIEIFRLTKDPAVFEVAEQLIGEIDEPTYRLSPLCALAAVTANIGKNDEAMAILGRAEQIVGQINAPERQAPELCLLAATAAGMDEVERAKTLLRQAALVVDAMSWTERAGALCSMAETWSRLGHWWQARRIADRNLTDATKARTLSVILMIWAGHAESLVAYKVSDRSIFLRSPVNRSAPAGNRQ
jgi:hypothetical protein